MKTVTEVIAEKGIKMTVKFGTSVDDPHADGWTVTLRYKGKRLTVPYYQGFGFNGAEPKIEYVVDSLLSDATIFDNARDFEDFCGEFGYDTDSRKAEKMFKECERISKRLHNFLGDDFDTFAFESERL